MLACAPEAQASIMLGLKTRQDEMRVDLDIQGLGHVCGREASQMMGPLSAISDGVRPARDLKHRGLSR